MLDAETRRLVDVVAAAVDAKKGLDLAILDVSELLWITEAFVIATGTSRPHLQTLMEEIEEKLEAEGRSPLRSEGKREGLWVLLDYGDFVVHLFQDETRRFYGLERLWGDAPRLVWEPLSSEA